LTLVVARLDDGGLLQVLSLSDPGVFKIQFPDPVEGSRFGWADLGTAERPLVEPAQLGGCPTEISIAWISGLSDPERLGCFGDRGLRLSAVQFLDVGTPDGMRYAGDPAWLAQVSPIALRSPTDMLLPVHVPPEVTAPGPDGWFAVRLRLDDPRSAGCHRSSLQPGIPDMAPEDGVLWCRQQLVVTGLDPVSSPRPETPPPDADMP